ncbi:MAG TPA: SigE family RNA polymerase sigma factor [Mycobacteriales bacterium]|nr:SigE family RNA polymerase sigma factor [Mycobacteriales bacterium]
MSEPVEFQDFVLARRRALLRTAWLLTGDWYAAEDLVQTALMRCYPHWRRISQDNPDAYVRKAIANAHTSLWRRRWRGEQPAAELPERAGADAYDVADSRRTLIAALNRLPARQRAAVVLRFYEDLSEAETATALGCSVGTVKSQTSKALAALRANGVLLTDSDDSEQREVSRDSA